MQAIEFNNEHKMSFTLKTTQIPGIKVCMNVWKKDCEALPNVEKRV